MPRWALYPLVAIATAAAIIASQALISGAFSLTQQAFSSATCPRMKIVHTSAREMGQIYVPESQLGADGGVPSRWCSASGRRGDLAAAYGIAVTSTMAITTSCFCVLAARSAGAGRWLAVACFGALLLAVDLAFFGANITKIAARRLVAARSSAAFVFVLMTTWKRGRERLVHDQLHGSGAAARHVRLETSIGSGRRGCRGRRCS